MIGINYNHMFCYADAFSCAEVAAGAPASMLARFTRVSAAMSVVRGGGGGGCGGGGEAAGEASSERVGGGVR